MGSGRIDDGIRITYIPKVVETVAQIHARLGQTEIVEHVHQDIRDMNVYRHRISDGYVVLKKYTPRFAVIQGYNVQTKCFTEPNARRMARDRFKTLYFHVKMPARGSN